MMSLKRSNDEIQAPVNSTIARPTKKTKAAVLIPSIANPLSSIKSAFTVTSRASFTPSTVALLQLAIFGPYTTMTLNDDVSSHILPCIDSETLPALPYAGKTSRDAAVYWDASFLLIPTSERHFVELAKKDGYNAYF